MLEIVYIYILCNHENNVPSRHIAGTNEPKSAQQAKQGA